MSLNRDCTVLSMGKFSQFLTPSPTKKYRRLKWMVPFAFTDWIDQIEFSLFPPARLHFFTFFSYLCVAKILPYGSWEKISVDMKIMNNQTTLFKPSLGTIHIVREYKRVVIWFRKCQISPYFSC